MIKLYYLACDIGLFFIAIIKRIAMFRCNGNVNPVKTNAIIVGNGPSLKKDTPKILKDVDNADIYCVNYMALDDLFLELKPTFYVLADPLFWRNDINLDFKKDNHRLIQQLSLVDWKMNLICPSSGVKVLGNLLIENENIKIVEVQANSYIFKSESLSLLGYRMKIVTPVFINVLILALWHAMDSKRQSIDVYGADFSFFKEYFVDQNTNELFSTYSHFYQNTDAQSNSGEKYIGVSKKKLHTRLYQVWVSFNQMYLLSLYAKSLGIKIRNCSSNSYLDCFDRV